MNALGIRSAGEKNPGNMIDAKAQLWGFEFIDCAVRSDTHFYLLATHLYELDARPSSDAGEMREAVRIAVHFTDRVAEKRWGFRTVRHIERMRCAVAMAPLPHLVAVSDDGHVYALGSLLNGMESSIPGHRDGPLRGVVRDLISIGGQVHVIQGNRGLCKRTGLNEWESICATLPVPRVWQERDAAGFNCAAGVSPESIYAGGDHGDLWHYDGTHWTQQELPINLDQGLAGGYNIVAMCCVDAGSVYVACRNGTLFLGHGKTWRTLSGLSTGTIGPTIKRMVACQGRVWATSAGALWAVDPHGLAPIDLPEYIEAGEFLAANDNVLLMAGRKHAAYFDGVRWQKIL